MSERISKTETDLLSSAIEKIINTEVLEKDISGKLPKTADLHDSNRIYTGKASILFVDMRNSTQLPLQFNAEQLVKIYRSYVRTIVQAVRYSNGFVRDFMGDGVLAVFIDDDNGESEEKAVYAARYITTAIDKFLNPVLDKEFRYRISCGIGIHTGEISLSKVGMKGKEQDETAENEFGIAWIGNSTNLACKQCSVVECGAIFINDSTYAALSDKNKKDIWIPFNVQKGAKTLSGYIAENHYLSLDEEVSPCVAEKEKEPVNLLSILQKKIDELSEQAKKLGNKEQELKEKEKALYKKEVDLKVKQDQLYDTEEQLDNSIYDFYCSVLGSGHCEKDYVRVKGQKYWEDNLKKAISAGLNIGKTESEVKQDVSYAMVSIYQSLEIYDKAYDFLVEQAIGGSWLHKGVVENIVNKVGYCERLKSALYARLAKRDLSTYYQNQFEEIKNWLVFEYSG